MYAYIKGILAEITEDAIIVENQGIGYEIAVQDRYLITCRPSVKR